jgi:hypothetical protein
MPEFRDHQRSINTRCLPERSAATWLRLELSDGREVEGSRGFFLRKDRIREFDRCSFPEPAFRTSITPAFNFPDVPIFALLRVSAPLFFPIPISVYQR